MQYAKLCILHVNNSLYTTLLHSTMGRPTGFLTSCARPCFSVATFEGALGSALVMLSRGAPPSVLEWPGMSGGLNMFFFDQSQNELKIGRQLSKKV